jgi:hypothetical protein
VFRLSLLYFSFVRDIFRIQPKEGVKERDLVNASGRTEHNYTEKELHKK